MHGNMSTGTQLLTGLDTELFKVLADNAPDAIKYGDIKTHFGRKVAIVRCV
jgi:hypothetical protein